MTPSRAQQLATLIVIVTGVLYGVYWLPVRQIEAMGLPGAWGTVAVTLAGALFLLPRILRRRSELLLTDPWAAVFVALGGAAFALYSIGFVFGHVSMIILLWFLTPVWSTLIARCVMGWPTPRPRLWAIVVGLVGLFVMLSAGGQMPLPQGLGEWMALCAGMIWAVATTGIRVRPEMPPMVAGFLFSSGAAVTGLGVAPVLAPWPDLGALASPGLLIVIVLGTGALWWGALMAGLMWAAARLDPARVGILLMAEVLIGSVTAALIAGERMSPWEMAGGALVLVAGVMEVWPVKRA